VFQWEEESARCKKACSFAVSAFQRFETIGNTHCLLPKGLLASTRNSPFLLVVFSGSEGACGTGRSSAAALASSPGWGGEEAVQTAPWLSRQRGAGIPALGCGKGAVGLERVCVAFGISSVGELSC